MVEPKAVQPNRAISGRVRIIGGNWRGRKLSVAPRSALRPSPDRVRETLFNWLSPYVSGARCLDLFAGTGVLGLEAVSRGAASATLLDSDPLIADQLHQHVALLEAANVSVIESDAFQWLGGRQPEPFDIVFLDPPFAEGYIEQAIDELNKGWLRNRAWVYLEAATIPIAHVDAAGWRVIRRGQTAQVDFALAEVRHKSSA